MKSELASNRAKERALEAYLLSSAKLGNERAMAQLVRLLSPVMMRHATRLTGDTEQAKDMVQAAWADIFRSLDTVKNPEAIRAFALQIVTRKVAAVIRAKQKERSLKTALTDEHQDVGQPLGEIAADAYSVRKAINQLSKDHQAILALFYLEDMTTSEVAAALNIPVGTVKTRLMHARSNLRAILEGSNHGKN
ncbi:RNA polymerase sigma-70 factor, ECF subfamily [Cognatiyoonia sediminum]|uniref:RNA polymerase sigma-70 factor, ECF subfamily n=1 Tax=Cognatiyoonia sediminum TaxID=1508389 RepID=A0A1M5NWB6_9RHOB|nr:sigma-70 family RNA polymerase sigma factor [Cognatiyoonia sediminum]SHG93273.1 RNA polymerase sigma-70 factor, ECF subfamily [Cognatiyoonia sediminum]